MDIIQRLWDGSKFALYLQSAEQRVSSSRWINQEECIAENDVDFKLKQEPNDLYEPFIVPRM